MKRKLLISALILVLALVTAGAVVADEGPWEGYFQWGIAVPEPIAPEQTPAYGHGWDAVAYSVCPAVVNAAIDGRWITLTTEVIESSEWPECNDPIFGGETMTFRGHRAVGDGKIRGVTFPSHLLARFEDMTGCVRTGEELPAIRGFWRSEQGQGGLVVYWTVQCGDEILGHPTDRSIYHVGWGFLVTRPES